MKYLGWIFVFLWASGYIASSIGLSYTNPLTFITLRVIVALFVFVIINFLILRNNKVDNRSMVHAMIVGVFIQFLYPVFFSYSLVSGISPAMLTIVLGLQPVLTLIVSRDLNSKFQIYGVLGCVLGTLIFSVENFSLGTTNFENLILAILSLLGVTFGSIHQKKYCSNIPIEKNMLFQCFSATLILLPTTIIFSEFKFNVNNISISALLWQSLLISVLSSMLLIKALKSGTVTNVSTYFSCVPAATAVMAYIFFDSVITVNMMLGMFLIFGCTWLIQNQNWIDVFFENRAKQKT
ncbi:DMT family transporter [Vibrio crassostreae]|uniref:DMT family transporter n=1 Tax=Vibrio crassostreae TaxID=246167 RepID=UPI002E17D043|nr:DMT family transporter [Vibrio crassostreae]